ncbi:hypothetical protein EC973_001823 [Apophysomyces ossiformis]|uniref:J domain-containing protein n=1 Tax=Apophysomyces ossiformis TaxID=679940 RepID=A0A8H7BNE8_9FUNG|nr:hypothetical protein EC973_001823 [Apophysomyces ossiformis]
MNRLKFLTRTVTSAVHVPRPRYYPVRFRERARCFHANGSVLRELHKVCWKCNNTASRAALRCANEECGVIQPTSPDINFFELLQVGGGKEKNEPVFDMDLKGLKRKFLQLQQKAHPDSFSQASKQEYTYAQLQSSVINKAYHTLKNPLSRAQYILALRGLDVGESESLHDPELLMDVMEVREELEEASTESDVNRIKIQNDEKMQETIQNLSTSFANEAFDQAKEYVIQLQYWENIRHAIIDWSPGKRVEVHH